MNIKVDSPIINLPQNKFFPHYHHKASVLRKILKNLCRLSEVPPVRLCPIDREKKLSLRNLRSHFPKGAQFLRKIFLNANSPSTWGLHTRFQLMRWSLLPLPTLNHRKYLCNSQSLSPVMMESWKERGNI